MTTKISAMTGASALDGTEAVEMVQGGNTRKGLVSALATYLTNALSAASTLAGTETLAGYQSGAKLITPAQIATYIGTLSVGDIAPARPLFKLIGANMNSTADQQLTKLGTFTSFILETARLVNGTTQLTTAAGGCYSAASKGGSALWAASQVYSNCGAAVTTGQQITLAAQGSGIRSDAALYLSLTTPQGGTATADLYVFGHPIS